MSIPKYLGEVKSELFKVTWPTRAEALRMTGIVVVASLGVGLYVGGLDLLFTNLLGLIIK